MTVDELKELMASVILSQKETREQMKDTDRRIKETSDQMKDTDRRMQETEDQMKKTDEKLERMGIHLGNVTNNQGDVAEEFFYNSLIKDNHLGSLYFDDITKNMQKHRGNLQEEYDLFMTNGDAIAIVEVKYKAHQNDLDKLDRKIQNFKLLFPIYQNYKLYGALASFYMSDDTKKEALQRGYFVLQRCGDVIHSENAQLKIL